MSKLKGHTMKFQREHEIKEKVLKGLDVSYKKLVKSKKELDSEFIISENGKIIRVKAHEIKNE